jgi:hypothetical protein
MADGSVKQKRLTFSPCSESNLFQLARKLLPAYHDGAPQNCRVCGLISALVQLFLSFFSPAIILFDNGLRKDMEH